MPTTEFFEKIAERMERLERKNLEQYVLDIIRELKSLNFLLDRAQEGIAALNADKEVLYLNRRMHQLLNLPDEVTRKKLPQIIQDAELLQLVTEAVEQKKEIFNRELEILLPRPMILKVNLLFEKKEKPPIFVLSIANLTDIEMSIRDRYQLANWETMLAFAAGIAHEIGNPLNSLTIHSKLLSRMVTQIPPPERKKAEDSIKAIEDELSRLDQIVRNFLKGSRRKPVRFESYQINELVEKTLILLGPELKNSKIKTILDLDKDMSVFLMDPDRVQQVFVNIIKNAVHAMPKGGTLKIQTEATEKLCRIDFQDTGVGIPSEAITRIFDPYYTTKTEGSGLGLMIVHQIIKEHGGRIEVKSKPNHGTTFSVLLPIRKQRLGLPQLSEEAES